MTFVTVPDKNAGDTFTQAMWATYVEGNLNAGVERPLADVVLSASAASIDFTSIPATFAHLKLICALRSDRAAAIDAAILRVNGDSTGKYDEQTLFAHGATISAAEAFASSSWGAGGSIAIPGNTAVAVTFASVEFTIPYYAQTGDNMQMHWIGFGGGDAAGSNYISIGGGFYKVATAPISRLTLLPQTGTNFVAGSRATLIGVPHT